MATVVHLTKATVPQPWLVRLIMSGQGKPKPTTHDKTKGVNR
jgi:hypothetical protein